MEKVVSHTEQTDEVFIEHVETVPLSHQRLSGMEALES
jgi:hypothetical protein